MSKRLPAFLTLAALSLACSLPGLGEDDAEEEPPPEVVDPNHLVGAYNQLRFTR